MQSTYFNEALKWINGGHKCLLATVIKTSGSSPRPVGAQLIIRDDGYFEGSVSGGCVEGAIINEALSTLKKPKTTILHFGVKTDNPLDIGIACGGAIDVLLEPIGSGGLSFELLKILAEAEENSAALSYIVNLQNFERSVDIELPTNQGKSEYFSLSFAPKPKLFIIGAVHIAQFLAPMAKSVGFDVTLIDNRSVFAQAERFTNINIIEKWPADALKDLNIDKETAIVTLTHDDKFDIPALNVALNSSAFYIGALGSRQTQKNRNTKLQNEGCDTSRIHGPVGLDINAKTPAEIAVSIISELVLAMNNKNE